VVETTRRREIEDAASSLFREHGYSGTSVRDIAPLADAGTRLASLVRAHVDVVTDDIERASVFVHDWRSLAPDHRAEIARRRDAYEARFRSIIEDGVLAGTFGAADPAVTAAFILTALNGLVAWYRPDGRIDRADLADSYADLILRAVRGVPR